MRHLVPLFCLVAAAGAFERPGQAQDDGMPDLFESAGAGGKPGFDLSALQEAMGALGGGGGDGDVGEMLKGMMNGDMMQQMQQAMQDPETMQKMQAFAEQMQQQMASSPQLKALTESLEGLGGAEGGLQAMMAKFQENPAMQEMAAKLKEDLGFDLGDMQELASSPDGMARAMRASQKAFAKMMSDPEQMEKLQEAVAEILPPGAMENMAEMMQGIMGGSQDEMAKLMGGGGGQDEMAKLMGGGGQDEMAKLMGRAGAGAWDKDEM